MLQNRQNSFHLLLPTSVFLEGETRNQKHFKLTVAMSIDAVASSMMKMLVFLTKALARQNSCLWPWLKFSPPSVTIASGSDRAKSLRPDQNRADAWKTVSHFQCKVIIS